MNYEMWARERGRLFLYIVAAQAVLVLGAFYFWGSHEALVCLGSAVSLILGFWVTEQLIGLFVGVKQANASAVALLCGAKLAWWGLLFYLAKSLPIDDKVYLAASFGASLVAIIIFAALRQGLPKISEKSH